jgi:hypothetical protein
MRVVLREYATLAYWTTLFKAYSAFLRFIYCIAPFSVLERKFFEIFDSVGVKLTYDEKELGKYDKNKYKVEILVKDKKFLYRVLDTTLGIGEAYMVRIKTTRVTDLHAVPLIARGLTLVLLNLIFTFSCTGWHD